MACHISTMIGPHTNRASQVPHMACVRQTCEEQVPKRVVTDYGVFLVRWTHIPWEGEAGKLFDRSHNANPANRLTHLHCILNHAYWDSAPVVTQLSNDFLGP